MITNEDLYKSNVAVEIVEISNFSSIGLGVSVTIYLKAFKLDLLNLVVVWLGKFTIFGCIYDLCSPDLRRYFGLFVFKNKLCKPCHHFMISRFFFTCTQLHNFVLFIWITFITSSVFFQTSINIIPLTMYESVGRNFLAACNIMMIITYIIAPVLPVLYLYFIPCIYLSSVHILKKYPTYQKDTFFFFPKQEIRKISLFYINENVVCAFIKFCFTISGNKSIQWLSTSTNVQHLYKIRNDLYIYVDTWNTNTQYKCKFPIINSPLIHQKTYLRAVCAF